MRTSISKSRMSLHCREDEYLDKIIKKDFSACLMNNRKWVKLLCILIENSNIVKGCMVKVIWDSKEPLRQLRFDENTQYEFDYYESAMEAMISGNPTGWYAYKEIEWLDFPLMVAIMDNSKLQKTEEQNLNLIKTKISEAGQFYLEHKHDNLRLYGYIRK